MSEMEKMLAELKGADASRAAAAGARELTVNADAAHCIVSKELAPNKSSGQKVERQIDNFLQEIAMNPTARLAPADELGSYDSGDPNTTNLYVGTCLRHDRSAYPHA